MSSPTDGSETLRTGAPHDEALAHAVDSGATPVVTGAHGQTGRRRVVVGSVTRLAVRRLPVPALTVRRPGGDGAN